MWGWISFVGHNWTTLVVVLGGAVALGVAAWFFKNWKLLAAGVVIVAAVLLWQGAYTAGYSAKTAEGEADRIKFLQGRLETLQATAEADRKRAEEAAAEVARLTELASNTPHNTKPALPRDAVGRIRGIR